MRPAFVCRNSTTDSQGVKRSLSTNGLESLRWQTRNASGGTSMRRQAGARSLSPVRRRIGDPPGPVPRKVPSGGPTSGRGKKVGSSRRAVSGQLLENHTLKGRGGCSFGMRPAGERDAYCNKSGVSRDSRPRRGRPTLLPRSALLARVRNNRTQRGELAFRRSSAGKEQYRFQPRRAGSMKPGGVSPRKGSPQEPWKPRRGGSRP